MLDLAPDQPNWHTGLSLRFLDTSQGQIGQQSPHQSHAMRRANTTATRPTGTARACVTVELAGQQSDCGAMAALGSSKAPPEGAHQWPVSSQRSNSVTGADITKNTTADSPRSAINAIKTVYGPDKPSPLSKTPKTQNPYNPSRASTRRPRKDHPSATPRSLMQWQLKPNALKSAPKSPFFKN